MDTQRSQGHFRDHAVHIVRDEPTAVRRGSKLLFSADEPTAVRSGSKLLFSHNEMPKAKKVEPIAHPGFWLRPERGAAEGYVVQNRASGSDWKHPSMFLRDLVAYATLAHRKKRGDFMFMGWQPHGAGDAAKNIHQYRSGLMLSLVSKAAFLKLETDWRTNKNLQHVGHVDINLKNYFSEPQNTRVCYISPPIAGYTSHLSGCDKEFYKKARPCIWMEPFACPGTRKSHDWETKPRDKWLCTFTAKGRCEWVCRVDVEVPDAQVMWLTCDGRPLYWAEHGPAEAAAACSQRKLRAGRALRQRETFRSWVEFEEEAGVKTHSTYCIHITSCPSEFCVQALRRVVV